MVLNNKKISKSNDKIRHKIVKDEEWNEGDLIEDTQVKRLFPSVKEII